MQKLLLKQYHTKAKLNVEEQRQKGMKQIICPQAAASTSNGDKEKSHPASKTPK